MPASWWASSHLPFSTEFEGHAVGRLVAADSICAGRARRDESRRAASSRNADIRRMRTEGPRFRR